MEEIIKQPKKRPAKLTRKDWILFFFFPTMVAFVIVLIEPLRDFVFQVQRATVPLTITYNGKPAIGAEITYKDELLDTVDVTGLAILKRQKVGRNVYKIIFRKKNYSLEIPIYNEGVFPYKKELLNNAVTTATKKLPIIKTDSLNYKAQQNSLQAKLPKGKLFFTENLQRILWEYI
jgi:hypothetical protein